MNDQTLSDVKVGRGCRPAGGDQREGVFLEICAGAAGLSRTMARMGVYTAAYDARNPALQEFDLWRYAD